MDATQNKATYDPEYQFGPGAKVNEYVVQEKIAEGGMGEVWVGKHPQINRRVAIKVLAQDLIANKKTVARFMQEARAVCEIRHRGLVDIFSFGELPDGRPYILMEYLEGKTLAKFLQERRLLPFSEVLELMRQISEALQAAHDKNIIHRDLKPDNIFLVFDGGSTPLVKLLDFGIAKLIDPEKQGPNLTRTGAVFGTPSYMSPEQCEGAKSVDHRSDIYALGILTHEMIAGRTPFRESNDEGTGAILAKQIHHPPPMVSDQVSGRKIPKTIDMFLLGVLSKDPEERPERCLDFYQGLVRAVGSLKNEDANAVQGAAPIYGENSGKIKAVNTPRPITKKPHTGNYYAGATGQSGLGSKAWALGGVALLAIGVGGYFIFSLKTAPPVAPLPASTPMSVVVTPTTTKAPTSTPKASTVHLSIDSTPNKALVFLNDEVIGLTPLQKDIPYGEKASIVRVEKEGFESKEFTFTPMASYQTETTLKKLAGPKTPITIKRPNGEGGGQDNIKNDFDTVNPFGNDEDPPKKK